MTAVIGELNRKGPKGDKGEPGEMGPRGFQGAPGTNGANGAPGLNGTNGVGVPMGGTTGQVLAKNSGADYDTEWVTGSGSSFDPDTILTGYNVSGELAVLIDFNGNVLVGI